MSWLYEYHNLIRDMNWLSLASTRVHTRCLVGLMLLIFLLFCVVFSFVCLYSTCVLCTLVFNMCFVYPMLPVSLDCLYSSCVLYTLCCQCLWIYCPFLIALWFTLTCRWYYHIFHWNNAEFAYVIKVFIQPMPTFKKIYIER